MRRPLINTDDDDAVPLADADAADPVQPVTWMVSVAVSDTGVPPSVGVTVTVLVACAEDSRPPPPQQQAQQTNAQCDQYQLKLARQRPRK